MILYKQTWETDANKDRAKKIGKTITNKWKRIQRQELIERMRYISGPLREGKDSVQYVYCIDIL